MEGSMTAIDRRKLMVGGAIGAAAVTFAGSAALANVGKGEGLKDLWRRLVELELGFGKLANTEDDAEFGARSEYETLKS
jgi:hypothetical protein